MSYVFEKRYTEVFEIEVVSQNFMKYGIFSRVRQDKPNCGLCDTPFSKEDNLNLAFVKNKSNMIICDSCAKKAIDGGAIGSEWKKS